MDNIEAKFPVVFRVCGTSPKNLPIPTSVLGGRWALALFLLLPLLDSCIAKLWGIYDSFAWGKRNSRDKGHR